MEKRFIRYRAWDKKHNKYADIDNPKIGMILWDYHIYMSTGWDGEDNPIWDWDNMEHDRYVFEQMTNLKDKNGNDIYEGDIIKMHWTKKHITTHEIRYFERWGMFGMLGKNGYGGKELDYENPYGKSGSSTKYSPYCLGEYYQKRMEIIGTKFEHPQLCEGN